MEKLLQFQKKVEAIKKDAKNPFFKSNYFDINSLLAEIKPLLNELGLVLLQPLVSNYDTNRLAIKTIIIDSETDKTLIEGNTVLPDLQDPQKMGSAITYYRRYALQSLLALQAEDDDGNTAVYKISLIDCKTLLELQQAWLKIPEKLKAGELEELKNDLKTKLK